MYVIRSPETGYKYIGTFRTTGKWLIKGTSIYSDGNLIIEVEMPRSIWNLFIKRRTLWIDEEYFFEVNNCNDK